MVPLDRECLRTALRPDAAADRLPFFPTPLRAVLLVGGEFLLEV